MKFHRQINYTILFIVMIFAGLHSRSQVLKAISFRHYIDTFNANDNEIYKQHIPNSESWKFLEKNIPLFDCPDKQLEQTYYFRWWTFRKHIRKTPDGFVITEFLPDVNWAGKYNTINCAAGHHIYEGRWLHNQEILKDYVNFWFKKGGSIRSYSTWIADAIYKYAETKNDFAFAKQLLPDLVNNFREWEKSNLTGEGLFWSVDDRDGMEMSVSGSGLRPTLNSYLYADALSISKIAALSRNEDLAKEFAGKAAAIKLAVQEKLWDSKGSFFKVIPMKDKSHPVNTREDFTPYGSRNVREILGYTPWYVNMVDSGYSIAWQHLLQKDGFYAPYGLTTTEQRHPGFQISYKDHECQWNGPSWPFATSITLTALANVLHNQSQPYLTRKDYLSLLQTYSKAHTLKTENGKTLPWIDENLNPFTGDWISRSRLKTWDKGTWSNEKGGIERGKDYNHSTFCDLVISGLVGLKASEDNTLVVDPLVPADEWAYFCLDNVQYHGRILTLMYDRTGRRYHKGKGFMIFVNNKKVASSPTVRKLVYQMQDE